MDKARMLDIEKAASNILKNNEIVKPFVNVFQIARDAGLSIEYRKMPQGDKDVLGFLDSSTGTIYVNVENSIARRTFTIAHELGHFFLKHQPDEYGLLRRNNTYTGIKEQKEKEADYFAANLLMPEEMIKNEIRLYPFLQSSPELLASKFGVSTVAMEYRLLNLNLLSR